MCLPDEKQDGDADDGDEDSMISEETLRMNAKLLEVCLFMHVCFLCMCVGLKRHWIAGNMNIIIRGPLASTRRSNMASGHASPWKVL